MHCPGRTCVSALCEIFLHRSIAFPLLLRYQDHFFPLFNCRTHPHPIMHPKRSGGAMKSSPHIDNLDRWLQQLIDRHANLAHPEMDQAGVGTTFKLNFTNDRLWTGASLCNTYLFHTGQLPDESNLVPLNFRFSHTWLASLLPSSSSTRAPTPTLSTTGITSNFHLPLPSTKSPKQKRSMANTIRSQGSTPRPLQRRTVQRTQIPHHYHQHLNKRSTQGVSDLHQPT